MRKCELCECSARMYCESDQASLCWDCDEKVHSANFLVAKHTRCLLCHVCQSLTPWKASGSKLGPTVSVCEACVTAARCGVDFEGKSVQRENQSDSTRGPDETDDEDDYDNDDDDEEEEEDLDEEGQEAEAEDEDENQVVPWSGDSPSSPPPPPVSSSSCSSFSSEDVSLKRMRDFTDICSDDEIGCSSQPSSIGDHTNEEAAAAANTLSSFRPLKQPRTTISDLDQRQTDTRSTAIISSLQRLQNQMITNNVAASATIIGICRLSRDQNR